MSGHYFFNSNVKLTKSELLCQIGVNLNIAGNHSSSLYEVIPSHYFPFNDYSQEKFDAKIEVRSNWDKF